VKLGVASPSLVVIGADNDTTAEPVHEGELVPRYPTDLRDFLG
jgi:hypothetical protein